MVRLFGKDWDRAALTRHVGDVRQIGGARSFVYDDGPERGVRAIEVRTGSGFAFTVLPDRGMDVLRADYQGASLAWHSPTGPVAPAFYEPQGLGWLRGFYGGMMVTCGLTTVGRAGPDSDLGIHGRASYTPAYEVSIQQGWEGDAYPIVIRGRIREAAVFGEYLVLTRTIRTALGESRFTVEDEVENLGHEPAPHMILYHVNGGFPALQADSELLSPTVEVKPVAPEAKAETDKFNRFLPPTPGIAERVYFHTLRNGKDRQVTVALVSRSFQGGRGLGFALRYSKAQLPCFTQWKMMGQGMYASGLEPCNAPPIGREAAQREGKLPFLAPGEKRNYRIEYQVLSSPEEIRTVEKEIQSQQEA